MVRSTAIEIIARRLSLNAGRVAALAQRVAESGELPKASGRAVPDLSPAGLAKLLLCAIADRGLGNAAESVREFAALRNDGGATLLNLVEELMSGVVAASGIHSVVLQLEPAAVTVVTNGSRLHYGASREHGTATHIVTIPGATLRAIVNELRDVNLAFDRAPIRAAAAALDKATAPMHATSAALERITAPARATIEAHKQDLRIVK